LRRVPEFALGFLVAAAIGTAILALTADSQTYYQICETNHYSGKESCSPHNVVYVLFWLVGHWFDISAAVITALATGFIAWFTLTLKHSTDRLWDAGERQLQLIRDNFVTERRPWLAVDAELERLQYQAGHLVISMKFKLKNYGNSPAMAVAVEARPFLLKGLFDIRKGRDDLRRDAARRAEVEHQQSGGNVVFPNQEFEAGQTMTISPSEIEQASHGKEGSRLVAANVFVCATYRFAFENSVHQTVGTFSLGTVPLLPYEGLFTKARFVRFGFGDYAD
jgi:hypothetical protein